MESVNRRKWIRQTSLAALGLGISWRSLAGEDYLPRAFGSEMDLINLGANENPYGLSPKAKEAIIAMMGEANRYSFNVASLRDFRKVLSAHYGIAENQVMVTAGSGEGLNLLARHFSKGNIVTANQTFGILPNTAKKIGTRVIELPLTEAKVHNLDAMLKAITEETNLVYICNPANPTGTMIKPAVMKDFCREASKKTMVLIDEAYIDFLDAPDNESMIGLVSNNPNVLVIRTFSKIYGMAGMRVGFIAGHPDTIRKIEPNYFQSTQFCVSNLALTAAMASLQDNQHARMTKEKNATARTFTFEELSKMGYSPIPSFTNFIYFPLKGYTGDFADDMYKRNIIVRSDNKASDKSARVSIGTLAEMQTFIKTLKKMKS